MKIRSCLRLDLEPVYHFIQAVPFKKEVFIKSSKKEIEQKINTSFVCEENGKIIGVLLVKNDYIDTIVSTRKGVGTKLLSVLKGRYFVHISCKNQSSKKLFANFGFKKIKEDICQGQKRDYYEAIL